MKKGFKNISAKLVVTKEKPVAEKGKPDAQWSDDSLVYSCNCLVSACTTVLRAVEDQAVAEACSKAIVCATVCSSHFHYCDDSSLLVRIEACQGLLQCCNELITALDGSDFVGAKDLLGAAQNCLLQCEETIGPSEEEAEEEAAPAATEPAATPVAKKTTPQSWKYGFKVSVRNEAEMDHAEMSLSGPIGYSYADDSGTSGKEFADALAKIPANRKIKVRVNSEGGSIQDGLQIYNLLKERASNVTSVIDGYALSCASLIALAADTVISPQSSIWMIHTPRSSTYGDAAEHKAAIKMLKTHQDMMADVYSSELNVSKDEANAIMEAETWYTGSEAVAMGMADAMDEDDLEQDDGEGEDADIYDEADAHRLVNVVAMHRFNPPQHIREIISARNNAGGKPTAGTAASPTQENDMNKTETTPVAAAPAAVSLEAFNQERKMRITGEVNRRAEGKVSNSNLDWWISQAMSAATAEAEQAIYKQLDEMPKAAAPGGEALRPDKVEASGARKPVFEVTLAHGALPRASKRFDWMEDERKVKSPQARMAMAKKDWAAKLNYCMEVDARESKGLPVAANTYSATLITDFLVDQAVTILVGRFAALGAFSIEFGPDRYKEYATGQTKYVVSTSATQKGTKSNPITNFEQGDGTVVPISVPMTHYVQSFNTSAEDMMNGLRIENLMQLNLLQFAKTVTLDALQPIAGSAAGTQIPGPLNSSGNVVNYSAGTIHINAGTFGWNAGQTDGHDLASLWAYLKNSPEKNLILDGNFYGRLTNSPGYFQTALDDERGNGDRVKTFGWDRIEENTVWPSITDSAGNAIGGLACNRQAIIGVTGLPITPPNIPGGTLTETVITLPGPDISISMFTWFQLSARKFWNSFELMGGFAGGDASAGAVIFNGKGSVS